METKKINGLMLGIFLLHIAIVVLMSVTAGQITIGVILSLSLGEIILLTPSLVYMLFYKISKPKAVKSEKDEYIEQEHIMKKRQLRYVLQKKSPSKNAFTIIR